MFFAHHNHQCYDQNIQITGKLADCALKPEEGGGCCVFKNRCKLLIPNAAIATIT